jgi:diacylglycerol kinase (ATP)
VAHLTTGPGDAERKARAWTGENPEGTVIVVGGDGTVHEALNGLLDAGGRAALAIVPAGTGNDIARNLSLPPDPTHAARSIGSSAVRSVDVGRCTFREAGGAERSRWFLNSVSVGVSARANRLAPGIGRLVRGPGRYPLAGALALLGGGAAGYEASAGPRLLFRGRALNLTVANGRAFGGGLLISPDSRPDDGTCELVVIGPLSRLAGLGALARLRSGRHVRLPAVRVVAGLRGPLAITADSPMPAEADGENFMIPGRFVVELLPGRLRIRPAPPGGP